MPDWLKDMWTSILDIWLPSKWPRLVATTAMGLEIGILTLSTWGPKFGLTPTESQMSIIRTAGSPWLFFFSLALIHYLVVRDKNASTVLQPWKFHEKKCSVQHRVKSHQLPISRSTSETLAVGKNFFQTRERKESSSGLARFTINVPSGKPDISPFS